MVVVSLTGQGIGIIWPVGLYPTTVKCDVQWADITGDISRASLVCELPENLRVMISQVMAFWTAILLLAIRIATFCVDVDKADEGKVERQDRQLMDRLRSLRKKSQTTIEM